MEPREIIITIGALSNIPLRLFNKKEIQRIFEHSFVMGFETFTTHRVRTQVVREIKGMDYLNGKRR